MNAGQISEGIWYALALLLVGSALFSRRFSVGSALGMIIAWGVIFALVLVMVSYRAELGMVATRVQSDIAGTPRQQVEGQALRVAAGQDGHYWVDGTINGTPARFLIDSGATITALSRTTAQAAGLNIEDDLRGPMIMQTANGPVKAQRSHVGVLRIGPIQANDLAVVVSPAFGEVNVLGMNLLSKLSRWQVAKGEMILEP